MNEKRVWASTPDIFTIYLDLQDNTSVLRQNDLKGAVLYSSVLNMFCQPHPTPKKGRNKLIKLDVLCATRPTTCAMQVLHHPKEISWKIILNCAGDTVHENPFNSPENTIVRCLRNITIIADRYGSFLALWSPIITTLLRQIFANLWQQKSSLRSLSQFDRSFKLLRIMGAFSEFTRVWIFNKSDILGSIRNRWVQEVQRENENYVRHIN